MSAGDFRLEPAGARDAAALAELERRAFDEPWSAPQIAGELAAPAALALAARPAAGGPFAGYVLFRRVADEAELLRVAVDPQHRRCGLGSRLLAAGLDRLGTRVCHLEVAATNDAARALYRAAGFTIAGQRRRYYRDGADALLLRREPLGRSADPRTPALDPAPSR